MHLAVVLGAVPPLNLSKRGTICVPVLPEAMRFVVHKRAFRSLWARLVPEGPPSDAFIKLIPTQRFDVELAFVTQ